MNYHWLPNYIAAAKTNEPHAPDYRLLLGAAIADHYRLKKPLPDQLVEFQLWLHQYLIAGNSLYTCRKGRARDHDRDTSIMFEVLSLMRKGMTKGAAGELIAEKYPMSGREAANIYNRMKEHYPGISFPGDSPFEEPDNGGN